MNNNYFKNQTYININETTQAGGKVNKLSDIKFAKNAVKYENAGGSATSLLGEATLNYMVAKASKSTKDVVTYFLLNELNLGKNSNINELVKNCTKCVEEYKTWSKKSQQTKNRANESSKFNSNYSSEVTVISKYIAELLINLENGAGNAKKVNKLDNNFFLTSLDYLVYNLATENQRGLDKAYFTNLNLTPNNAPEIADFKADYLKDNGKELTLHRVHTGKKLIDSRHLNDSLIIDSEFSGSELPENFNVYGYYNLNKDFEFLTNNNKNNCVLTFNNETPALTIAYPKALKNAETGKEVEINYQPQIELAVENIKKKYPKLEVEITNNHVENLSSSYSSKKGNVKVLVNASKPAEELNQSNAPKNLINLIFQTERALNQVTVKDINKTLNLTNKNIVNKKGVKAKNTGVKAPKVTSKELNVKERNNSQIFKSCNIKNHAELIQRAIAVGSTMNSLKLNGYLSPEATKASCLFLQSQFNKTISLLSSNNSLWIMPYISKKIANSFEREVSSLGLTKKEVLQRFADNGMPVIADETFTLQQIISAKPNRTLSKQAKKEITKSETKEVQSENETIIEQNVPSKIATAENKVEKEVEKEIQQPSAAEIKSMKDHEKLVKLLNKNSTYKKIKYVLPLLQGSEKAKQPEVNSSKQNKIEKILKNKVEEEQQKATEPKSETKVEEQKTVETKITNEKPTETKVNEPKQEIKTEESKQEKEEQNSKTDEELNKNEKETSTIQPKIVIIDPKKVEANITKKIQKIILEAREKVTSKIDKKASYVKNSKKSDELVQAYNFTAVFADTLGASFSGNPREDIAISTNNTKQMLAENIEKVKKQATVLTEDYVELVNEIVKDVCWQLKENENTTIGRAINSILKDYKPAIENLIIQEVMDNYDVKLTQKQKSEIEAKLKEKLYLIRQKKIYNEQEKGE